MNVNIVVSILPSGGIIIELNPIQPVVLSSILLPQPLDVAEVANVTEDTEDTEDIEDI